MLIRLIALDMLISNGGFDSSPWAQVWFPTGMGSIPHLRKKFSTGTDPGLRTGIGETYAQMLLAFNGIHCDLQL
jgi:hypothetical protein